MSKFPYNDEKEIALTKKNVKVRRLQDGLFSYLSSHGHAEVNLNGEVKDLEDKLIVCRHFAYAQTVTDMGKSTSYSKGIRHYQTLFSDKAAIEKNDFLQTKKFDNQSYNYAEHRLFPLKAFGMQLFKMAEQLNVGDTQSYYLESFNHGMTVTLRYKKDEATGQDYYVVKFFDPNQTATHVRVVCGEINLLKDLTINNFLSPASQQVYFPDYQKYTRLSQFCSDEGAKLKVIRCDSPLTKDQVAGKLRFLLATPGSSDQEVTEAVQMILSEHDADVFDLLLGQYNKSSGLHMVNIEDNGPAIAAYFREARQSSVLTDDQKEKLVCQKSTRSDCFLFATTLSHQVSEVIKEYVQAVLNFSHLNDQQKSERLCPINSDGTPAFYYPLQNGNAEVVRLYVTSIFSLNISDCVKATLLSPKHNSGEFDICFALYNGQHEMVLFYMGRMLTLNISSDHKFQIMYDLFFSDEVHALYFAMQDGNADIVKAFVKLIINAPGLSSAQKKQLLQVKREDKTTGLWMAVQIGHKQAVQNYFDPILASGDLLEENDLVALLRGENIDGKPLLQKAIETNYEVAERYIELIAQALERSTVFNPTLLLIETLLMRGEDNNPWIFIVMQKGDNSAAILCYINVVLGSKSLTVAQKKALITGGDRSALFEAMHKGHSQLVGHVMGAIMQSTLPEEDQVDLLMAEWSDVATGLYGATFENKEQVVATYIQKVLQSKLKSQNKVKLLMGMGVSQNNASSFYCAMESGEIKVVAQFIEPILASSLSGQEKVQALSGLYDSHPLGLYIALQCGHNDLVDFYVSKVLGSRLNNQEKRQLLLPVYDCSNALMVAFERGHDASVLVYIDRIGQAPGLPNDIKRTLLDLKGCKDGKPLLIKALEEKRFDFVSMYIANLWYCQNQTGNALAFPPIDRLGDGSRTLANAAVLLGIRTNSDQIENKKEMLTVWLQECIEDPKPQYQDSAVWQKVPEVSKAKLQNMLTQLTSGEMTAEAVVAKVILASAKAPDYQISMTNGSPLYRLIAKVASVQIMAQQPPQEVTQRLSA